MPLHVSSSHSLHHKNVMISGISKQNQQKQTWVHVASIEICMSEQKFQKIICFGAEGLPIEADTWPGIETYFLFQIKILDYLESIYQCHV